MEVVSGSMEPTIHVGDLIVIHTKDVSYSEGDIVTFYDTNEAFVTHRIMSIDDGLMITKGDNNNSEDQPIPISQIVGKYVFKLSGVGQLFSALRQPFVMIMIFAIGILFCILMSLDKDGKIIVDSEYEEFLKYKEQQEKNSKSSSKKVEKTSKVSKTSTKTKEHKNKQKNSKNTQVKKSTQKNSKPVAKQTSKEKTVKKKNAGSRAKTNSKTSTTKKATSTKNKKQR